MKTAIVLLTSWLAMGQPHKELRDDPLNPGEYMEFKMSYGWFTVGRASWYTNHSIQNYKGEQCYKFRVRARSAGFAGVFARVEDEWGAYVRTRDLMPMMNYRDLKEGKYILDERTYFDYGNQKIRMERIKRNQPEPTQYFDMNGERFGMLGGFMQMRQIDYNQYKSGDLIKINAFFEGELFNMDVIYKGVETITSKVGQLRAHKIVPIMPENKIFPGKYPITAWLSADKNQLPLRVDADMFFGSAYIELVKYKNVKYGIDYE